MCGPQDADKNGIANALTDARVLVFVICSVLAARYILVGLASPASPVGTETSRLSSRKIGGVRGGWEPLMLNVVGFI